MEQLYAKHSKTIHLLLISVYFGLCLLGIWHHEIWLDEAHHWLLARDSNSLAALYKNSRYEGHPIVWNTLLYGITRLSTNPFWMQVLHISITTWAIWIFLKNAPFSILVKFLFIFGYFTMFEYAIISRNYGMGMLFVFLALAEYTNTKNRVILLSTYLALAVQTHAIFLLFAGSFMCVLLWENRKFFTKKPKPILAGVLILSVSFTLSILQILPPEDSTFLGRESLSVLEKVPKAITPFFKGLFVFPDITTIHFWNTNGFFAINKMLGGVLALAAIIGIPLVFFSKNRVLLFYIYLGIAGAFVFFYITQLSAAKYWGILYLLFISALWMLYFHSKTQSNPLPKYASALLYLILITQSISGVYAFSKDIKEPFTNAKQVVNFLHEIDLENAIIATRACDGTPISAYAEKKVFFTKLGSFESFCRWNKQDIVNPQEKEAIVVAIEGLLSAEQKAIVFISYQPIFNTNNQGKWVSYNNKTQLRFLEKFEGSIVKKGSYYVYEFSEL